MLLGGLAGLSVSFMARPATLLRRAQGAKVNFQWVPGALTEIPIRAVIQAPSESDLRQQPEGERAEGYVTVWTKADLRISEEDGGTDSDRVRGEDGQVYKITRVVHRTEAGFTRAIGRLERDGGRRI